MSSSLAPGLFTKTFQTQVGPLSVIVENDSGSLMGSGFTENASDLVGDVPVRSCEDYMSLPVSKTILSVNNYLKSYFNGSNEAYWDLSNLAMKGTPFQLSIWEALGNIPFGDRMSYKELAMRIGNPRAYRAAGTACGANNFALLIPCHRIVESNGLPGNYRWGNNIKNQLLDHERIHARS